MFIAYTNLLQENLFKECLTLRKTVVYFFATITKILYYG